MDIFVKAFLAIAAGSVCWYVAIKLANREKTDPMEYLKEEQKFYDILYDENDEIPTYVKPPKSLSELKALNRKMKNKQL